jgi:hypothetical protein
LPFAILKGTVNLFTVIGKMIHWFFTEYREII